MSVYARDDITLFQRAVNSIYNNSLLPDAFILIIDGPVPIELQTAIRSFKKKYKIQTIELPINIGLANALNQGLKRVQTNWVVRADADDYNLPERFGTIALAIDRHAGRVDIIGSAILEVDNSGAPLTVRRLPENHSEILRFAAFRSPFNHMTVAYRTELALKCGGYPNIYHKEDYGLWAKMLGSGAIAQNLSDVLVFATAGKDMYRRRGGLRYAFSEIYIQKYLVRTGLKSPLFAVISGLIRSAVFLMPISIRSYIYKKFLRSRVPI